MTCNKFNGECQCKSNIIGDKCEKCQNGNFGFPSCKSKFLHIIFNSLWLSLSNELFPG